MKELTTIESCKQCSCKGVGIHRTPWCELLNELGHAFHVMNFWYKLDWLQKEIEKRSSYLGKLRRTEEAQHLLDLIAMTKDEEDLFYPFANAAMADVFDELEKYTPRHGRCYFWNENIPFVKVESNTDEFHIDDLVEYNGKLYIAWLDNVLVPVGIVFDNTEDAEDVYSVTAIRDEEHDAIGGEHTYCFYDEVSGYYYYCDKEEPEVGDKVYEWGGDNDFTEIGSVTGDTMGWDGIELEKKLVETFDWRKSIHYLLAFPRDWHVNVAEPLDTAIFEALVARIMFKWLEYAYPDEAPRYLEEWNECIKKVRNRCSKMYGQPIVKRIPRIF